jgi:hypothetical protein
MTRVPSSLAAAEKRVFAQPPTASGGQALLYIDPAAVPRTDKITIGAFGGNGISLALVAHDGRCPPGSIPGRIGMNTTPGGHR